LDKQGGQVRQVFTPSREEPVAIFLPQHRPGRMRGPSLPVVVAAIGTVMALGAGFVYMMPVAPQGARAPVETVAAAESAPADTTAAAATSAAGADAEDAARTADAPAVAEPAAPVETAASADAAPAASAPAAEVAPRTAAVDIPSGDDPRWAKVESASSGAALQAVKQLVIEKAARSEDAGPDVLAYANGGSATDPEETSAVVRRPMQIVLPEEPPTAPAVREVTVRAAVNMRSGPGSGNGVILVIPRQARVQLHGCEQWCKVGYDGRVGYIYKSFVPGQGGSARATTPSRGKAEQPAKTVAVVSTVEEPEGAASAPEVDAFERQRERR
jgi:uncharacterized protein YraI